MTAEVNVGGRFVLRAGLFAVDQNLQCFISAVGNIARQRDILAVCGDDIVIGICSTVLRMEAAMCEAVVFDADMLRG